MYWTEFSVTSKMAANPKHVNASISTIFDFDLEIVSPYMTRFAPYLEIITHLIFLDCIFGYTDWKPLHWYQIYVATFSGSKNRP